MVLQKRLDYGFKGYQVPPTPRAARSARKRGSFKKSLEDNQMCAFDLLAIVAGKLLLEKESTPCSTNTLTDKDQCAVVKKDTKDESQDEEKTLEVGTCDQGRPARNFFVSKLAEVLEQNCSSKESLHMQNDLNLGLSSAISTSDYAERFNAEKLVHAEIQNEMEAFANKVDAGSSVYQEHGDRKLEGETKKLNNDDLCESGKVLNCNAANVCSSVDPLFLHGKPPRLVSLDNSAKVPHYGNFISHCSYPVNRGVVNVVSRDDDENSSGCSHPATTKKFFRPAPRIGDRRIRKIIASRYLTVASRLKNGRISDRDGDLKPVYHSSKDYYKRQRSERIYPFKKRKHFKYCSPISSDGGISSKFIYDSPRAKKGNNGDVSGCCPKMNGASEASSSIEHTSFQRRDSHVKLRIKSFRVPELFIEIPEAATIGSLKRTVMEAVTAILEGGLRVGVLLQGKKIRDDNKTLLQTGISHNNQLDALGFSLEPNPSQASASLCLEPNPSQAPHSLCPSDSPLLIPCDSPQPLRRYPLTPNGVHQTTFATSPETHVSNLGNSIESDLDSAPSPDMSSIEKNTSNSKALVAVPALTAMNVDALSVVPAHRKSKRSEIAQRRIRRPFSVAEVEALVQAVEKLGTGRWRDVKLRAFDHVKHRTYVDLKDKWKTLVHTARISPQQRRGEPVPQELLDRVLTAHAFWSQQQVKQPI